MAFEKYTNVPIFIITTNDDGTTTQHFLLAKDFSFSNQTSLNRYTILGKKTRKTQYAPNSNKEINISINSYIDSSLDTAKEICKLAQKSDGFTIKIGETIINYCYVDSVSYTITPFQPVILAISIKAYQIESKGFVPSLDLNINQFELANGAVSQVTVSGLGNLDILEANISINSNREVRYTPGSIIPMRCDLVNSELTAQITVSGVGDFISYEGKDMYLETTVLTTKRNLCFQINNILVDGTDLSGMGEVPCVCTSQQLSIDEGGFISGSINLNSILV